MQILSMTSCGRESTKLYGDFAVYITFIIMMLITILLMIEDRCNTSFAKKMLPMYISMKTGAKQTWSFTLNPDLFFIVSIFAKTGNF